MLTIQERRRKRVNRHSGMRPSSWPPFQEGGTTSLRLFPQREGKRGRVEGSLRGKKKRGGIVSIRMYEMQTVPSFVKGR